MNKSQHTGHHRPFRPCTIPSILLLRELGQKLEIHQRGIHNTDVIRLRKISRMFVEQVGQSGPEIARPALLHAGDISPFTAPPSDDPRRGLQPGAADAQVIIGPVAAGRLHAPGAVPELQGRGRSSVNGAGVAVGQGLADAGTLRRLQVAGAVGARCALVADAICWTPSAFRVGRAAQLRVVPQTGAAAAAAAVRAAGYHLFGQDVGEEVAGDAAAIAAEDEEDVVVFDGRRETEST